MISSPPDQRQRVSSRILLIYNPTAGSRRIRKLKRAQRLLQTYGCLITLRVTEKRGDAEQFARHADSSEFDAIVVAGGDGTIAEAMNGLHKDSPPLGLLPLGTANVLSAEVGLGNNIQRATSAIALGVPTPVYAGVINGRLFCMMAGIGFDSRVVEGLNPVLKRRFGKLAYVISLLQQLKKYAPPKYEVCIEGDCVVAASVVVAKGHYYGGRFILAPKADLRRPALEVVVFRGNNRWELIKFLLAVSLGSIRFLSNVYFYTTYALTVSGRAGECVQCDGDLVATLPISISVSQSPITLLLPP